MSNSPEEKISTPIHVWIDNADQILIDWDFDGTISNEEFENLDLNKLWDLVAPDLKDLIKEHLCWT